MPDKNSLNLVLGNRVEDLRKIRLPGLDKSFEQLTISELVQLRPGSEVADSYEVNAVTDNISVTSSSMLAELGRIQGMRAMQQVVHQDRLNQLKNTLMPDKLQLGGIGGLSAEKPEAAPNEVRLASEDEDVFKAGSNDPFKQ